MMISTTTGNKALILGALLLVTSLSQAHRSDPTPIGLTCDTPSPSLLQLGAEQYYDLTPIRASLTASEIDQLATLYDQLQGRWQGRWSDHYCLAGDRSTRMQTNTREFRQVNADVRKHGQLSFRADGLMVDLAAASELTSLEFISKDSLVMTLRSQRGTVPQPYMADHEPADAPAEPPNENAASEIGQSALRERHDTLTLLGKELRLETRWYINGFYSGSELTTLHKVR